VKVPNGFAVTAEAYRLFLKWARLDAVIWLILKGVNTQDLANLQKRSK
jgi:pyruvate,water dikinase